MEVYAQGGVNRISLGVQSMVDHILRSLGRTHDPANVDRAVEAVRAAGIPTFNLDVIYGAAGESPDDWRQTLDAVLALDPPHVSAYALTVEPGTPLADDPGRHPDDDDQAAKYLAAAEALEAAGLSWYEISNWARPGHECRHNQLYWSMGEYQAFGCAGHSHRGGRRSWNVHTPERYIAAIDRGALARGGRRAARRRRPPAGGAPAGGADPGRGAGRHPARRRVGRPRRAGRRPCRPDRAGPAARQRGGAPPPVMARRGCETLRSCRFTRRRRSGTPT